MRFVSWPRALALTSLLALVGYFSGGVPDQRAPGPAGGAAMNREIERRLDLAVNGSPPHAIRLPASPPSSSGATHVVATLFGVLVLGGFAIAIRWGILAFARMRRSTSAGQAARYPAEGRGQGTVARPF